MNILRYNTCPVCHRNRTSVPGHEHTDAPCAARLAGAVAFAHHDSYGCDTGCCGIRYVIEAADGATLWSEFDFSHPDDLEALRNDAGAIAAKFGIAVAYDRCTMGECQYGY
jgi:hypothetical protein